MKVLFPILALFLFSACSTGIDDKMPVPNITTPQVESVFSKENLVPTLFVGDIRDGRPQTALAVMGEKKSEPEGDITLAVSRALQEGLKSKGFEINDSAPVVVTGEVRTWLVTIKGGVPSKGESSAALSLEVYDPANKKVYSGVYQGSARMERSTLSDQDISRLLGVAMTEAIGQALSDKNLIQLLASF